MQQNKGISGAHLHQTSSLNMLSQTSSLHSRLTVVRKGINRKSRH